jgi:sigma-B regulation protein RsbU (phosphoserine phosphatase)
MRAGGAVEFVGNGGLPLGMFRDARFESFDLTLAPGDRLFLMSDGLIEAEGRTGEQLGTDGLAAILTARADQSGPELLETIYWDLAAYTDEQFSDDVSGALFEFFGPKPGVT